MKSILRILLLLPVIGFAQVKPQQQKVKPFKFETIVQTGLLAGGSAEAFTLQTVNGFRYEKWFAGIGTGFDFYMQRSIPLFADVRYDFTSNRKTFFLYSDAGINFAWTKNKEQQNIIDQSPGLFTDAGVGLKITTKKKDAFLISAGYSYKHLKETQHGFSWWPIIIGPGVDYAPQLKYDYSFNRIAVKVGFVF